MAVIILKKLYANDFGQIKQKQVPDWVKTTSQFWIEGHVPDSDFTNSIGYLISEDIIKIKEVEIEKESEKIQPRIPQWIAETTKWWIEGQVPEDQFLEGIRWLVSKNIISGISNPQKTVDPQIIESPVVQEINPTTLSLAESENLLTYFDMDAPKVRLYDSYRYLGIWKEIPLRAGQTLDSTDTQKIIINQNLEDFQSWNERLAKNNQQLIDVEINVVDEVPYYSGVSSPSSDVMTLVPQKTWGDFENIWYDYGDKDLRQVDIESHETTEGLFFSGIYEKGTDDYALFVGETLASFNETWETLKTQGLLLKDIEYQGSKISGVFREGASTQSLVTGTEWSDFVSKWQEHSREGNRLTDIETFVDVDGRKYSGIFNSGNYQYGLWQAPDFQNFVAQNKNFEKAGFELVDFERFQSQCTEECMNLVLNPKGNGNFKLPTTKYHCNGQPPCSEGEVKYNPPQDNIDGKLYVRISAIDNAHQIFTLPFKEEQTQASVKRIGYSQTWNYDGSLGHFSHQAIDYVYPDRSTFPVLSAAPGTVIFAGYHPGGGNTIVVSHDAEGVKDLYRTVYIHLRNGADHDCAFGWLVSTKLEMNDKDFTNYVNTLEKTGCKKNDQTNLDSGHWGTNDQIFNVQEGDTVNAGDLLAYAGTTGPGGGGLKGYNNHLHMMFAKKDTSNDRWYFFDPYGIYAEKPCYPHLTTDPINTPCQKYVSAWKGGNPSYPD